MDNVVELPPRRHRGRQNEGARGSWWARHRRDIVWNTAAGIIAMGITYVALVLIHAALA